MAFLKKKEKKGEPVAPKAAAKVASPKQSKPKVPPDVYTLLLGLAALFLIVTTIVLGLNYHWYQTTDPAVLPLNWAR
jgi:hypothetical protein